MLRRRLAAVAVSLALVSGLSAAPAHAASSGPNHHPSSGPDHHPSSGPNHHPPCALHSCQIPEAPWPIGLPIVGLGVLGGYVVLMRRRDPGGRSTKIAGTQ
jgi:hypothetical protein